MAFSKPLRGLNLSSRSAEDLERGALVLERIASLLDRGKLRSAVIEFHSCNSTRALSDALGDPAAIARELVRLAGPEAHTDLEGRIANELKQISTSKSLSEQALEAEVDVVREELTRYWVDLLGIAWRRWSTKSELRLDARLLPDIDAPDWRTVFDDALTTLLDAVALTPDGVAEITGAVVAPVRAAIERDGMLALPDGLALVVRAGAICVVRPADHPSERNR